MTDQEYFAQYRAATEIIFSANQDDCAYLKDADLRYQNMSNSMLKIFQANSIDEVINKTVSEIMSTMDIAHMELEGKFLKQDQMIIKTQNKGRFLEVISHDGKLTIVVLYKIPIINPETNNVVGIHGVIHDFLWPSVIKTLFKMHGGSKGVLLLNPKTNNLDPLKEYPINNMQHMVLFLSIHNYSYSEIALLMNEFGNPITPIRVNDYLEQLKLIFHVRTKTQLIEKAIGLNFHAILPCDLFKNVSTIEISKDLATIICCNCKLNNCTIHVRSPQHSTDDEQMDTQ